jgi:hypothetical protein
MKEKERLLAKGAARASPPWRKRSPRGVLADFWGTVKNMLRAAVPMVMLQACPPATIEAQELIPPPTGLRVVSAGNAARTNAPQLHAIRIHATALTVLGKCDCSEDGGTFTSFARGQIFAPGAIIRTGEEARADLFFRRSGTTVRLQPGTEIKLEKIAITLKDGHPSEHVALDLHRGKIFAVVRSAATGSTLEIRNAAGLSVVEGNGGGSYIIAADGTYVSAAGSVIPLKLVGENGTAIIAAGQQFTAQDGKMLALSPGSYAKDLAQLDELKASADGPSAARPSPMP